MKRQIKANTQSTGLKSSNDMFELVQTNGVGINDTPWEGLEVKSYEAAYKHVVQIRLTLAGNPQYNGELIEFMYKDVEISHGMRSTKDTLEDTREYIDVLEEALDFVPDIIQYMKENGYWAGR